MAMNESRKIIVGVAAYFHESPETLLGRSRRQSATIPRYFAMKLMRDLLGFSYPQVGRTLGRTHSTAINGVRYLDRLLKTRPDLVCAYNGLRDKLEETTKAKD